jgi:hypothetical protein
MNSQDAENQAILESLVAIIAAIRETRQKLSSSGYYIGSTNRPINNRLIKAQEAITEAIGSVSARRS